MKKLVIMLVLMVAVSFAASTTISNSMLVETVIHHTPTGFVPLHSGDGAGYYFWDSNESSDFAPTYSWIDCTGGTEIGLNGDDTYVTITTPAAWRYCGVDKAAGTDLYVGSNGYMGFNSGGWHNYDDCIEIYGDDLVCNTGSGSHAYSMTDSSGDDDLYILEFNSLRHYGSGTYDLTFQGYYVENNTGATINNTVVLQYNSTGAEQAANADISLTNADGSDAAVYADGDQTVADGTAIIFIDAAYVDNFIGAFDLTAPADGSEAIDGNQVTFDWEDASYSGTGTLTYDLILSNNADLSSPFHTETVSASTFDYTFSQGNTSDETVYWGVEANEDGLGLNVASDSIWSITLHQHDYAIEETTWGQIKSM